MSLTIFSTCKPFSRGAAGHIQRRSILSWSMIEPRPKIVLFGDEEGVPEICEELGLINIPEVRRSPNSHCPLLNTMFEEIEEMSPSGDLLFLNADIILTSPYAAIKRVRENFSQFLIVGHRSDVKFAEISRPGWIDRLLTRRTLGPPDAIDYFIFTPGLWGKLPTFVVGHVGFDNWLIWSALHQNKPVIDATQVIHAFHQKHEPREANRPDDLANLKEFNWSWADRGRITDADWILKPNELIAGEGNEGEPEPIEPEHIAVEALAEVPPSSNLFHGAYVRASTVQEPPTESPTEPEPPAISYSVHKNRPTATSARVQRILDRLADRS